MITLPKASRRVEKRTLRLHERGLLCLLHLLHLKLGPRLLTRAVQLLQQPMQQLMWKLWRENQGRLRKNNDTMFIGAGFDKGYMSSTTIPITLVLQPEPSIKILPRIETQSFETMYIFFCQTKGTSGLYHRIYEF
jgi:hypothetical protein